MGYTAKDVMERRFLTVNSEMTIREAVEVFRQATEATGQRVFGLMVTDNQGKLVGMLSMYDIFLLLRPKHIHIWGEMAILTSPALLTLPVTRLAGCWWEIS